MMETPRQPSEWKKEAGWHRYDREGQATRVPYPEDRALVFDVETLVNGNYPVMATAVSKDAW